MLVHLIVRAHIKKCLLNPVNKHFDNVDWVSWERCLHRLLDRVNGKSAIVEIMVSRKVNDALH